MLIRRILRMNPPTTLLVVVESSDPGGAEYMGENLSGNPGMVQPMQMPPICMHPPMPLTIPRSAMLHWTTGPQQPSSTRHSLSPYSWANTPSS